MSGSLDDSLTTTGLFEELNDGSELGTIVILREGYGWYPAYVAILTSMPLSDK